MEQPSPPETLYVISSSWTKTLQQTQNDQLMGPETDAQGRILFRTPVKQNTLTESFVQHMGLIKDLFNLVPSIGAGFEVEGITVKLGIDAKVGCVFIADASVESSIEIRIARSKT